MEKKFRRYLYSFWRNSRTWQTETDGQTDGHRMPAIAALWITSHGKNVKIGSDTVISNIAGALHRVTKITSAKTKWSAAGEWSQCHASVSSNSHVFKRLRKERSDGASLTAGGRLFQARAATTVDLLHQLGYALHRLQAERLNAHPQAYYHCQNTNTML